MVGTCWPWRDGEVVHVSHKVEALMQKWHSEGMGVRKIGVLIGRTFETVSKHMFKHTVTGRCSPRGALAPSLLRL